jgi:SH3 domain-containing YSC84-like protein 1
MLRSGVLLVAIAVLASVMIMPAFAETSRGQTVIDRITESFGNLSVDPNMGWFRSHLKNAHALVIMRQFRAGFIVGATGGSGVMMSRDQETGMWSQPAFYGMGAGSVGLQIGANRSEVALLVMSQRGRDALLSTSVTLGGDMSVAAGPVGAGAAASTADILSFSRNRGLFGGIAAEGTVISPQNGLNHEFYGAEVSPLDIMIKHKVSSPGTKELIAAVTKMADEN